MERARDSRVGGRPSARHRRLGSPDRRIPVEQARATVAGVAPPDRRPRRGTFAAFRRPVVGDPVFWLAAAFALLAGTVVGGGLLLAMGVPDRALPWIWPVGAFVLVGWLAFKLLAMGINTSRALEPGADPSSEARAQTLEAGGRAAGAVLGKGTAKLVGRKPQPSSGTAPPPTAAAATPSPEVDGPRADGPAGTPTASTAPDVTVDKAARVLGSMVGRRLADRKRPES
jgi:hypothetical protein